MTAICRLAGGVHIPRSKDLAARGIFGWTMADQMCAELGCEPLQIALGCGLPVQGLEHHSDRDSQYAGRTNRKNLAAAKITQSMSRKGQCLDNASVESSFASLKKELVRRCCLKTRDQAKAEIFPCRRLQANDCRAEEYFEVYYNRQRRHSAIGHKTPQQVFEDITWKVAA